MFYLLLYVINKLGDLLFYWFPKLLGYFIGMKKLYFWSVSDSEILWTRIKYFENVLQLFKLFILWLLPLSHQILVGINEAFIYFCTLLEAKSSKGMHQVCIKKSPDRHLSENISTCCVVFVKCFGIALFCFILNQSGQLRIKEKSDNIFTGLNVFFKALNFRFWQISQSFD